MRFVSASQDEGAAFTFINRWLKLLGRPCWVLMLLAGLIVMMRIYTYEEPLESDLTTYAVIGKGMLQGRLLYTDLWDHKPPAIYVTYAVAIFLFGYGRLAVFMLGVGMAVLTLAGIYKVIHRLTENNSAALWGAVFWALLSSDLKLQANQPNAEAFMNFFLVWGLWFFLKVAVEKIDWWRSILAGSVFAAAALYKQIAIIALGLAALGWLISIRANQKKLAWPLINLGIIFATVACFCGAAIAYFACQGRFQDFYEANIIFNRFYSANIVVNLQELLKSNHLFPLVLQPASFLLALSLLAWFTFPLFSKERLFFCWAGYLLSAPLMVALPGKFFNHYYQLWLPPLAIGAGLGLMVLAKVKYPALTWVWKGLPVVVSALLLTAEIPNFFYPASYWPLLKYNRILFNETERVGIELGHALNADETFFVWGGQSGSYFAAHRLPPTGAFCKSLLEAGPLRDKLYERMMADLIRNAPEAIVVHRYSLGELPAFPEFASWLRLNYVPIEQAPQRMFLIFVRQSGRLAQQLQPGSMPASK